MIVPLTGLIVGALLFRKYRVLPILLRTAVFAQIADVVTFAIVWNGFQEERNPLANLILQTVVGLAGDLGDLSTWFAALVLIGAKYALIAYLVWAAPVLGRYQRPVLVLAIAAGAIGAVSNFRLFGIFIGPENIPLLGIVIGLRDPRSDRPYHPPIARLCGTSCRAENFTPGGRVGRGTGNIIAMRGMR